MSRRIFIVEDHPVMREGYRTLITRSPDLEVCGEATSGLDALAHFEEARPDLMMVDLSIPGMTGVELIKQVRALNPDLPILVVSAHSEALYAERALRAGARGYLMKDEPPGTLLDAVRQVLEGTLYLSPPMRDQLLGRYLTTGSSGSSPAGRLSDRELEVFEHIGHGLSTRLIAEEMLISPKTVESHRVNIKKKLGVQSSAELIQKAALWAESLEREGPKT